MIFRIQNDKLAENVASLQKRLDVMEDILKQILVQASNRLNSDVAAVTDPIRQENKLDEAEQDKVQDVSSV